MRIVPCLLAALPVSAARTLQADAPPKAFPTNFGLSTPIWAISPTIGVTYYGWEGTTVFGHTLWAFSAQQYAANLASGCFFWNPSPSCGGITGVSIATKPYGAASSPNLPNSGPPGPIYTTFGWTPNTEIIFAIAVNQLDGFNWFFSGDPSRNADGFGHVAYFDPVQWPNGVPGNQGVGVIPQTAGLALFGFEDVIYEHSDWDFDNVLFGVDQDSIDPPTEVVPEPGTMLLMATGMAGMAALRRRRRPPPAA